MKQAELVRMANQIADFFNSYPHDHAVEGVARHVQDFWDPRMKADIKSAMAAGDIGLKPLAREGLLKTLT